ncbi:MAG: hypothetical protein GTO14_11860 [Anaerolineales bacterium]|nr:hypothetical protein [Anaerolineales bacterium]
MSKTVTPDDDNLLVAVGRLRRSLRVWAGLFAAAGFLTLWVVQGRLLVAALPWLVSAILLALGEQPAYLALAAVQWGLSLIILIPSMRTTFGPDPLAALTDSGVIENIALALVRVILMVTAWNQFMFYRMLYGTSQASGIDPRLPGIPEVIPNKSDLLARLSPLLGLFGALIGLSTLALRTNPLAMHALGLAYAFSIFAIGLGVGAAFSPTNRRGAALTGVGLGVTSFLMSLLIGRFIAT